MVRQAELGEHGRARQEYLAEAALLAEQRRALASQTEVALGELREGLLETLKVKHSNTRAQIPNPCECCYQNETIALSLARISYFYLRSSKLSRNWMQHGGSRLCSRHFRSVFASTVAKKSDRIPHQATWSANTSEC